MDILLANPRGFCAGVDRAIAIVDQVLAVFGTPIYVRHEIVHNHTVVADLKQRGVIFIEELADIPDGAVCIFSAHGVPQAVRSDAAARQLRLFDATCPLVTKVHSEVARHSQAGLDVVLIGHRGHPEVEGTLGQCPPAQIHLVEKVADVANLAVKNADQVAYVTQTTLSMDDTRDIIAALQARFPKLVGPRKSDICYATQNRQNAVRTLAQQCELVLVIGSATSSNSKRLRELAERHGTTAYLVDGSADLHRDWFADKPQIGITAGASAPESLVAQVLDQLREWGATSVTEQPGIREEVVFALPPIAKF
ncbi:4-hydroxy-3-methylbut-2-enyl diphosphate reductase [Thiospirillum jenense]|uniref:4-hydroxy-3-methylbut-2-enyl diphosphate reductase n=1 Tax=Thiospirillum jenense TaxID=1653858 RepID=A0A839HJE2_9GAMM|nr:4-hydroxy-3-methylbut-2-enyl diphosphate reductase [Thiospirillum jenense]MBB1126729.1 4-hydroxy-3-methylbut-2-enyl diphosphate reductase [Thiospirillum jenense]